MTVVGQSRRIRTFPTLLACPLPPIATESVRRNETSCCARTGHLRRHHDIFNCHGTVRHWEDPMKQISRRTMLGTAATLVATPAFAEGCPVGPPQHHKGPLVFMDYDQLDLDASYDQVY